MLLGRKDVNCNQTDTQWGSTPLSWAATKGHEGVVKMLLEQKDVNPDQADTGSGRTPLSWAAEGGYEGIVKMLLEREDVDPNRLDTEYGRAPLSWAVEKGHEGIVNMLMGRKNVFTATPDNTNQTPQPPALSEGHNTVVSIPQERGNVNCAAADHGGPSSLTPSPVTRDECAVGMQLQSHDSSIDMAGSNGPPEPLPVTHHQQSRLVNLADSISKPADSGGPSAQSPLWPQSLPIWPPELSNPPPKTDAHPSIQPIFSFAVNRSFVIAFFVCLFAFLLYIFPSSSLDIFSLRGYLPGEELA